MEDVFNLNFADSLKSMIILILFQCCVVGSACFLKRQQEIAKAMQPLICGLCFLILSEIFFIARTLNEHIIFRIFEIFSFSMVLGMFVTAALLLRGIKGAGASFAGVLSLTLFCFMIYSVFISDASYLKYLVFYLSSFLEFCALSFGFLPRGKKQPHEKTKADYGFYITSILCLALAITNIIMISGKCRAYFGYEIYEVLYISLALSLLLASTTVLENRIVSLENEVSEEKQKLLLLVQSSPFPIIISRLRDEKILLINKKAESLLGIKMSELPNCQLSYFFECPNFKGKLLSRLEKKKDVEDFDIRLSTDKVPPLHAGTWFSLSSHIIDFNYEIALYTVLQDITKRKLKEQELFNEATKDSLTGCYTRRFFEELVKKEIAKSSRTGGEFCFVMIDADHFKNINDTYGHDIGDKVLRALADTCHKVLRGSDIVCRFGGEEFLILLTDITPQNAEMIANRLRETIGNLVITSNNNENFSFTVSMGLATSSHSTNFHTLVTAADAALYQAKNTGRNKVVLYTKDMGVAPPSKKSEEKTPDNK